jgi:hypothetical protein
MSFVFLNRSALSPYTNHLMIAPIKGEGKVEQQGRSIATMKFALEDAFSNILVPSSSSHNHSLTRPISGTRICISLLGEMKIWLEMGGTQVEVFIKSHRRQELLAYIATMAPDRSKKVSSSRILTDVFEHIAPRADADNLRSLFQKHTQILRKEINQIAQEAGFPKLKLFQHEKVDNSSTKWWLSDECRVVDLSSIKLLYEKIEAAEEKGLEEAETLDLTCNQLIRLYQSYKGDYLEAHLLGYEFGDADWARVPFTEYRDMYLRALWDAAISQHSMSMQVSIPDLQRYKHAKRASLLYRTYALRAPSNRQFDLNARKSKRQSERALRGHLRMCRWLMDAQTADGTYSTYEKLMAKEFPDWKPNPHTIEILRAIRQHTGESMSLGETLEPPEEMEE